LADPRHAAVILITHAKKCLPATQPPGQHVSWNSEIDATGGYLSNSEAFVLNTSQCPNLQISQFVIFRFEPLALRMSRDNL